MTIAPSTASHHEPLELTVLHELMHAAHLFAGTVGEAAALEWTLDFAANLLIDARREIERLQAAIEEQRGHPGGR